MSFQHRVSKFESGKIEENNQDIVTEGILFDLGSTKRASVIKEICQQCNLDSNGSTMDCLF